jgi:thiamine kinase-like enzyme
VRCIPRPIAADRDSGCAVYEYIDGKKIASKEVTDTDVDYAVQFLARLKELRNEKGSRDLPPASEACFSVQAIVSNIELRLNRLSGLPNARAPYSALHGFLTNDLVPSFDEITKWCKSSLNQPGMSFASELLYEERTLSPSDFGFHNALRRSDGPIVFLDFEYFGWDDPAKMISDFLLHPAMELHESLKRRFMVRILDHFADHRHLAKRVEIVYPLFGLKWCLIFLNEFVPEHLLRRGFASRSDLHIGELQAEQLAKARQMLHRIRSEYEYFPYRG